MEGGRSTSCCSASNAQGVIHKLIQELIFEFNFKHFYIVFYKGNSCLIDDSFLWLQFAVLYQRTYFYWILDLFKIVNSQVLLNRISIPENRQSLFQKMDNQGPLLVSVGNQQAFTQNRTDSELSDGLQRFCDFCRDPRGMQIKAKNTNAY